MPFCRINALMIPTARCVFPTPCGPMNSKPNETRGIGYSSTNFSAAILAFSIERSGEGMMSKFSNSHRAYRSGIFAASSNRSARASLAHSQRMTPSTPSWETRVQLVPPHAGQIAAGSELMVVHSTRGLVQVAEQLFRALGAAEFSECPFFDLPDTFARKIQFRADFG